jgi:hypothetical protein
MLIHASLICKMSTTNTNICYTLLTISSMHICNISTAILLGRHPEHHCKLICSEFLLSSCRCNSKCLYLTDVYLQLTIPATGDTTLCNSCVLPQHINCRVLTFLLQNNWLSSQYCYFLMALIKIFFHVKKADQKGLDIHLLLLQRFWAFPTGGFSS